MRGIVLSLLLTLAVSQKTQTRTENTDFTLEFEEGKCFQYNYEATVENRVQGGVSFGGSAFKLNGEVVFCRRGQDNIFRFRSLKIEDDVGIYPKGPNFHEPSRQPEVFTECLRHEFVFNYNNGIVSDAHSNADPTCANIQKGVVNMVFVTQKNQRDYELQEDGLEGECNTKYIKQEDRKAGWTIITRARNLNNCKNKRVKNIGMSYLHYNPNSLVKDRMVQGSVVYVLKIKHSNSGKVQITQAESEQVYLFTPFGDPKEGGVMKAVQKLTLTNVRNEQVPQPRGQLRNVNLHYEFPEHLPHMLINLRNPKQQIEEILEQCDHAQGNRENIVPKYLLLPQLLRHVNVDTMNAVYNKFATRRIARHALLTGVVFTGTLESMKFLSGKLTKGELHDIEMYWILPLTFHFANPKIEKIEETAKVVADILSHLRNSRSFLLQKLIILASGSFVHRQCSQSRVCNGKLLEPLNTFLAEAISENNENRIILGLKAVGNAGQMGSLKLVKQVIDSDKSPEYIQAVAVQALTQIGKQDPIKGQAILLQMFMDPKNPVVVRLLSSVGIFTYNPPLPIIITMANAMVREPNLQIVSFVYSQMKAWTNNRIPMYYSVASGCNIAIKLLNSRLDELPNSYSKVGQISYTNERRRAGLLLQAFLIEKPGSLYPTNFIISSEIQYFGATIKPLELAFQGEGLRKLFWNEDFQYEQYSAHQKIKDTEAKLPGFKEFSHEKPLLSFDVKAVDQVLFFFTPNEIMQRMKFQDIKSWLQYFQKIIELMQVNINTQFTPVFMAEMRHCVPITLGMVFETNINGIVMVDGALKAKTEISHNDIRQTNVQAQFDSNIVIHGQTTASWGVNTEFMQNRVEITAKGRSEVAAKFNATLNMGTRNFKIDFEPLREPVELLKTRHEAYAVARYPHSEKKAPVLPEGLEIDIFGEDFTPERGHVKQTSSSSRSGKKEYCLWPTFSTSICLKGSKTENTVSPDKLWLHLCGNHTLNMMARPVVPMEKIQVEIQLGPESHRMKRDVRHLEEVEDLDKMQKKPSKDKHREPETDVELNPSSSSSSSDSSPSTKKWQDRKRRDSRSSSSSSDSDSKSSSSSSSSDSSDSSSSDSSSSSSDSKVARQRGSKRIYRRKSRDSSSSSSSGSSSSSSSSSDSSSSSSSSDSSSSSSSDSSRRRKSSSSSSDSSSSSSDSSSSSSKDSSSSSSSSSSSDSSKRRSSSSSSSSSSSDSSSSSSDSSSSSSDSSSSSSSDSSSSSSSSSSSESVEDSRKKGRPQKIYEFVFRSVREQQTRKQQSGSRRRPTTTSSSSSGSSRGRSSSSSSSGSDSSSEEIQGDSSLERVMLARLRIIRRDKKPDGLNVVMYAHSSNVKLTVTNITKPSKPVICLQSAIASSHKAMVSLKAGWGCQDYHLATEIETGEFANYPAIQMKVDYPKVPALLTSIVQPLYALVPGAAYMLGFSEKIHKNPSRQATLIFALTHPRNYLVVAKMPDITIWAEDCMLPFPVAFHSTSQVSKIWEVPSRILASLNGVCSVEGQRLTTFNGQSLERGLVQDCYMVLLQDCTCHKKFMLLMKYESDNENNIFLNATVGNMHITFKLRNGELEMEINGTLTPLSSLPLKAEGMCTIERKDGKLFFSAEEIGLEGLEYDGKSVKVTVNPKSEYLCGLCGLRGADVGKYRTPSGYFAKDEVSFAQSWVVPDECEGACKLKHTTVKHGKPHVIGAEDQQCASTLPVLRCKEGCTATRTADVSSGFHCISQGASFSTDMMKLAEKSEDLVDTIESHLSCSCNEQQCEA